MKNAIIIAGKRTGSTFLQESLNSHPDIICHDEMFMNFKKNKKRRGQFLYGYMKGQGYSLNQYIDGLFSTKGSICFRLMYPHAEKNKNIIDTIKKKNIPIIHLIRENKLHHFISSETKKQEKVKIKTNKMRKKIEEGEQRNKKYRDAFKNNVPYLEIYYENMFGEVEGDREDTKQYGAFNIKSSQITYLSDEYTEQICKFFNVNYRKLYCNVTKRNSWNIWKHIKNKDEVKNNLKNTKGEKFLKD